MKGETEAGTTGVYAGGDGAEPTNGTVQTLDEEEEGGCIINGVKGKMTEIQCI